MTHSMRIRLFVILVATTGLVWLSAVVWIFGSTRAEVESVLDARLMEAAQMVSTLMSAQQISAAQAVNLAGQNATDGSVSFSRQLSCQIWSIEGKLISKSEGAPADSFAQQAVGFSETKINGETWRVYAIENKSEGIRVLVGDNLKVRDSLVNDVIKGLLLPAVLILPLLGILIWLSVARGLAPLNRVAAGLRTRSASDLSALPPAGHRSELAPMISALNGLFKRLGDARERERNFTAFAAHELRTPLAGLKTQAQIALASEDADIRQKALTQIAHGVDRTGRLVRQLLDLSALEAQAERGAAQAENFNPGTALEMLAADLRLHAGQASKIRIARELYGMQVNLNHNLFALAARNLLENAINHAQGYGTIECNLIGLDGSIAISVDDHGPGIAEDEIGQVTERFFRGRNKTSIGSGLGLSIVSVALEHAGASLSLVNNEHGGLSARIVLKAESVERTPFEAAA
jgi:two-component system sensor histidine kinase QseC